MDLLAKYHLRIHQILFFIFCLIVSSENFAQAYCTPAPSSVDGTGITNVSVGSINNTTGDEAGHYGNYSAMSTVVIQGATVTVNITYSTGQTYLTRIWVDWNLDGDFADAGEEVYAGTSTSFSPTTLVATFTVPAGASLGLHRMRIGGCDISTPTPCYTGSWGSYEDYSINVTAPAPMVYVSSSVSQASTLDVYQSAPNQEIICVQVVTSGSTSPLNFASMIFSMLGTTLITDVSNIDIYYTGLSSTYTTTTLYGSAVPASGNITVSGTQTLSTGTNYFWIVYDISATATDGNVVDAECTQIGITGVAGPLVPTGNPPAGVRPIITVPASFSKWIDQGWAKGVVEAAGGDLVWGGRTTNTYSSGSSDVYFARTANDLSSVVWSRVIGTATSSEQLEDIVKTADGYVGVGWTNMTGGASGYNILVTKVNDSGVLQWTRTIGTSGTDYGYGICLTSDGNVAISGNVTSDDGYFAKLDNSNGNILAEKTISYPSQTVYLNDIIQTTDGGYLMVGKTASDFYMIKLTSTYTLDWGRSWGGANNDELTFVVQNAANDYTVGGSTYSYGSGSCDGYIMRFTISGGTPTVSWTRAIGTADGNRFSDGELTADGGYIVSGLTNRLGDPLNDEAYCVKINSIGGTVFLKSIGTTSTTEDQEAYDVFPMSDGSYAMAGLHNNGTSNFYLVKLSAGGFNCATIQDNGTSVSVAAATFTTNGSVSNPFSFTYSSPSPTVNVGGVITGGCVTTVLPIELLSFTGYNMGNENVLNWQTISEMNNDYFTIERSANAIEWEAIGKVKGAGNSYTQLNYSFIDEKPFQTSYYRLRQTDYNMNSSVSNIISISKYLNGENTAFVVYPNPTNETINIQLNQSKQLVTEVEVLNSLGQLVAVKEIGAEEEITQISIDKNLAAGMYLLILKSNQEVIYKQKIVKN